MSGFTADALARTIDATEMAMVADWVDALPGAVARRFGAELIRTDSALALAVPGTATGLFNRVLGLGVFVPARRDTVRRLVEFYRRLDTPFLFHLNPYARPAELGAWLEEQGLVRGEEWLTGYRYPDPVERSDSDFTLTQVDRRQATVFAATLCGGYGMPPEWAALYEGTVGRAGWWNYLAIDGDVPVATASLFRNGRTFWQGNSATLAAYRRRGAHTALNRRRLADAVAAGADLFTGESWKEAPGRPNQSWRNHMLAGSHFGYLRVNYRPSSYL